MAACHAADPGSIPGRRKFLENFTRTLGRTPQFFNTNVCNLRHIFTATKSTQKSLLIQKTAFFNLHSCSKSDFRNSSNRDKVGSNIILRSVHRIQRNQKNLKKLEKTQKNTKIIVTHNKHNRTHELSLFSYRKRL